MHAHENVNQLIIGHRCCTNLYNINTTLEHHLKQSHKRLAVQSYIKASVALFLAVNLVVFALASACGGNCPTPTPSTPSTPTPTTPGSNGRCPRDALKLGVCANVLGLIKAKVAVPSTESCCPLLEGLVDLEAAVCLCTAIKGNIVGINLNLPVDLSLILNHCGKSVPAGFKC